MRIAAKMEAPGHGMGQGLLPLLLRNFSELWRRTPTDFLEKIKKNKKKTSKDLLENPSV